LAFSRVIFAILKTTQLIVQQYNKIVYEIIPGKAKITDDFIMELLSHGPDVEVLAPSKLRKK
jgi:hypothetical protein